MVPTPEIMNRTLQEFKFEIIQFDDTPDAMWGFYICGRKQGKGLL